MAATAMRSILLLMAFVCAVSSTSTSVPAGGNTTSEVVPTTQASTASNETTTPSATSIPPATSVASMNSSATSTLTTATTTTTSTTTTAPTTPRPEETVTTPARSTCPESDQIHCGTSDRCTRIRYICDGDNDCGDSTDEESALCAAWRNNDCERNNAKCVRGGRSDCVTISHYCTLTDPPCEGTVDPRLCQMLKDGKIQPFNSIQLPTAPAPTEPTTTEASVHVRNENWSEQFLLKLNSTIRHPDCPWLYTKVGDHCLSIFFIGNMSWMEARTFCQTIGGDLFSISKDFNMFATLLQHFTLHKMTADFWIGGRYVNDSLGWTWVDETAMPLGSPYWAVRHEELCTTRSISYDLLNTTRDANDGVCYNYVQAPKVPPVGHCSALTYKHYYYMSDENCFRKKSPLCVLTAEHPKQAH